MNIIGMVTTIIIVKNLSTQDYGLYGLILSVILCLKAFSSLGLSSIITRNIARDNNKSDLVFVNSFCLNFFASCLISLLVFAFYLFEFFEISNYVYLLICLLLFTQTITQTLQDLFFGLKRMEPVALFNIIFSLSMLILILILPEEFFLLDYVLVILLISSFIRLSILTFAALYFNHINIYKLISSIDFSYSKKLIIVASPFYVTALLSLISNQFPIQFLGLNSNNEEIAFFNASNKLITPFFLLIATAMTALFPNMSIYYRDNLILYKSYARKGFKLIVFFGSVFAFSVGLFSEEIIYILFGERYAVSSVVLLYLSWYLILFGIFNFIGSLLGSSDNQKTLGQLSFYYAFVNCIVLWIFSKYGAIYLAIGFNISSIINLTYHCYLLNNKLKLNFKKIEIIEMVCLPIILIFLLIIFKEKFLVIKIISLIVSFVLLSFLFKKRFKIN